MAVISSPSSPSVLLTENDDAILSWNEPDQILLCRGATFRTAATATAADTTTTTATSATQQSIATTGAVATAIVVDGITVGDLERGLLQSRHSRTLTALFRAKLLLSSKSNNGDQSQSSSESENEKVASASPQTLILVVHGDKDEEWDEEQVASQVKALYAVVLVECSSATAAATGKMAFDDNYKLQIVRASDKDQVC